MAFSSRGGFGTAGSAVSASGSTLAVTTATINVNVGDLAIAIIGCDNVQTTDGNTNQVASIADTAGNTWQQVVEFTNGQTAAAAGATCAIWYSKIIAALNTGGTVTVTFASSITARACLLHAFSTASSSVGVATTNVLAGDAADFGSIVCNPVTSRAYLFLRGGAQEGDIVTYTPTTNYTATANIAGGGGGGSATLITASGEFRLLTATSSTSQPSTGLAYDTASVMAAFFESPALALPPVLYQYQPFLVR